MTPNFYFANKYLGNNSNSNNMSIWSSIASGASGLLGGILNESFSDKHLKDAQNFAMQQGDKDWERAVTSFNMSNQRDDDVWNRQKQYNIDMWNMQNLYNSPAAQMSRFKEAGLNPHLIYGQSNMGGSMATANLGSGKISGTSGHSPSMASGADWSKATQGLGDSLMNYVAFKQASAQVDNTRAYTENLRSQRMLQHAQALTEITKNKGMLSDNIVKAASANYAQEMAKYQTDSARLTAEKVQQDIDLSSRKNTREEAKLASELQLMAAEIQANASKMSTEELQRKVLDYQIKLYELGPKATDLINRYGGSWLEKGIQGEKEWKNAPTYDSSKYILPYKPLNEIPKQRVYGPGINRHGRVGGPGINY